MGQGEHFAHQMHVVADICQLRDAKEQSRVRDGTGFSHAIEKFPRKVAGFLTGHFLFLVTAGSDSRHRARARARWNCGRTGSGGNSIGVVAVYSVLVIVAVGGIVVRGGILLPMRLLVLMVGCRRITGKILSQPS